MLYLFKSINISLKKILRISLLVTVLTGQMLFSFADRGVGKKKTKIVLNIKSPANFNKSLNFNLRTGLKYTGSLITAPGNVCSFNTLVTYTKGNSIYILPYKQKIIVADIRQGYSGTKLIIRRK
jgi:hypothetical protein